MVRPVRADVVVVGGGPVGMLVAAELGRYGVAVVVLEREVATSERPKATTLHARTVQTLARRGYVPAPEAVPAGGRVTSPFHFAGIPGLHITAPAGEPVPVLKQAQAELEQQFEGLARVHGVRVLREHRVTEVGERPGGVRVVAEGPEGVREFEAAFVVGADGAHSSVREQAGFVCDTYGATVSAMMGLVRLDDPDALETGWHRTGRGWVVAKAVADGTTHLRTVNFARTHADRGRPLSLDELRDEVSQIMGRELGMSGPRWLSRFSDVARLARSYRRGRVLLVGDAAHLHFPIGGQGLSTGLLDALNLGWKLAATVRGTASGGLLDSYDAERRPAAERVIANVRAQVSLMHPEVRLDALRGLFGDLLVEGRGGAYLGAMVSAQDTVLPARSADASALEGTFLQNVALVTASGRTDVIHLLRDGRMLLLLFGAEGVEQYEKAAQEWAHLVRIVRVEPVEAVSCAAVLVRPDGYIAWGSEGGSLGDALGAYLVSARASTAGALVAGSGGWVR